MTSGAANTIVILGAQPEWLLNVRGPLIRDLVDEGYRVVCVGSEHNEHVEAGLEEFGGEYRVIGIKRNQVNILGDALYCYQVYKLCDDVRPQCVLAYTAKPIAFGCAAASLAGVPSIFALVTGLGSVFIGDSLRQRLLRPIVRGLYSLAFKRCSRVLFQNPDDLDLMRDITPRGKSLLVNGSGIDVERFLPSEPGSNPITFLLIARLLIDKGIREYVNAAREIKAQYPDTRFLLVGPEDPGAAAVPGVEIAQIVSGSDIEFLGSMKDVRAVLRECSVYVLPSYREGTPRTVLEAMACGRAVITTDAPGCRETVVHGKTGLLVPAKDGAALARAMRRLIESPEMISAMGKHGREYAESRYDVRKVNRIMIDEIETVINASQHI